ncbi:MAG: hypothetical protein WCE64_10960 [Bacteroidales bacterium]
MKKIRIIFAAAFLLTICALPGTVTAQEISQDNKEKELKSLEELNNQKNTTSDQKIAHEEQAKAMQEQQKALEEAMKNAQEQIDQASKYGGQWKLFKGNLPEFQGNYRGEPFVLPEMGDFQGFHWDENSERTSWNFAKSVKDASFSRDYIFDVDPGSNSVVMSINGDCKAGDIRIKIIMPGGKTYSDTVIDESVNLNWRKSFQMSNEENKDKAGAWKFQIDASKAPGYFKISLQTF